MDSCIVVVTADRALADLLRPQVENQGFRAALASSYEEATLLLGAAAGALVDLELPDGGLDVLARLRIEDPNLGIVAIATNEADADAAAGHADRVLREPLTIADLSDAVRQVGTRAADVVIDLRAAAAERTADVGAGAGDDLPWFATR